MDLKSLAAAAVLVMATAPAPAVAASFCSPPLQPACMVVGGRNATDADVRRCRSSMSAYEEQVRGYVACLRDLVADQEALLARITKQVGVTNETGAPGPSSAR